MGHALDAAAAKAYGEGYDKLSPLQKMHARERMLPIFNAILPQMREVFAELVEYRAQAHEDVHRTAVSIQLRHAASDIRKWPEL